MDFIKILELLNKAFDALAKFIGWQSDAKSKLVAYLVVPCAAVGIAYVASGQPGTLFGPQNAVSIVRLSSHFNSGKIAKYDGIAVLVEPSQFDCKLPLPPMTPQRLVSSLLPEEWERNLDRVDFRGADLHLQLPLWGVSRPVVILADGEAATDLWLAGAKVPIESLQLTAQHSLNLVTWGFVSAVFGLGLGFASESTVSAQNAGREQGGSENEH